ncbi:MULTISPECIES: 2-amino-4-hydroxy-6-hydroxymethyldihydropteridine diphosphokinase [Mycolicibacterium]|uniref:2-amino-4-hydroxy-6-hydroxymethyldihydropteridine diphosphokinase n=1 Tax=Mycolicibacterium neoaurum TaxID=1795 RepID=A0AAV2WTU6_MYCNE|nr:2-amino-4-hydroxy-6-hydroxymethyldihydropteridine diphosphokinase [Mycolicibacterium neoaurum]TLH49171.1 2-amino-4-hydroxy-6-hydroxymethyldihydropteridine diphosphokinase [Mycolicibacterium neoaurum]CDQ47191.1 2-amino-4-hydroxy-6-hydroxymethyldihydropteridinepyrophosphokinase [Mycolicibacterium neoaurum]SDC28096.1 2-amino-4-hydroxy-6-hydroxymethyldihydropteridinediphosphokinase [Mycolicibacterium neoaurum]
MRTVLSIGSNLGDRLAHLQSVVDDLGARVAAVSPVYETDAWGGVEQDAFLNAVLIADDPALDGYGWLRRGQTLEAAARRVREVHWGPRTLDVDVICCRDDNGVELLCSERDLTLPHPHAHERAFVLIPWLAADPDAELSGRPVADLLAELAAEERDGVRRTDLSLAR